MSPWTLLGWAFCLYLGYRSIVFLIVFRELSKRVDKLYEDAMDAACDLPHGKDWKDPRNL